MFLKLPLLLKLQHQRPFSAITCPFDAFLETHASDILNLNCVPHPHVRRLRLRRLRAGAEALEIVNLKLYLQNRCIIAENEMLRERASALRRENLALLQNLSKTAAQDEVPEAGAGAA